MRVSEERSLDRMWCCLHCRGPLALDGTGLDCTGCGRRYPVISGIPILVRDPAGYLRSELASLTQASHLAKQRRELLAQVKHDAALPQRSLDRHEDVIAAEISQAEMLLVLLEPAAKTLETLTESGKDAPARRAGWAFDTLLPYLIRDWTNT